MAGWEDELERWLMPFLDRLGHKTRQRMCPLYIAGLIGPGDRKSVQPMAERLATSNYDQLHHFIADGVWDATPLEAELLNQAGRLVGGRDAVLVIDDTSLPKKGERSVGVAAQYASALGKTANCQTLVSLTLARGEVPVMVALRLFLPDSWTSNVSRLKRARVPVEHRTPRSKPETGLRLNQPCQPYVTSSSISSFGRRLRSAHIAESKSLKNSGENAFCQSSAS